MPVKVIYKLKEPQVKVPPSLQKETLIYLFFNYGYFDIDASGKRKYKPLKYSTSKFIRPHLWHDRPTYRVKKGNKVEYQLINQRLDEIESSILRIHAGYESRKLMPRPDQLRTDLNTELKPAILKPRETLTSFLERFETEITSGQRLTSDGKKYKWGTIRNYQGLKQQLDLYYKKTGSRVDFDDVTIDFYDQFLRFFNDKKASPNTVGKHIKSLKVIMRAALEEDLHDNTEFDRKKFKVIHTEVFEVYLSEDEIMKIAGLNLSSDPVRDLARDVFLVGCFTAQRYSDYSRICQENIKQLPSGGKVIELTQKKTGERVVIPIGAELDRILRKYNYNLPRTWEQKVNDNIKKVVEKAGITGKVYFEETRGGMRYQVSHPKNELVKTHTARRSGATNMYLAGIPTIDIMKITGHRTEKEFLKYIKVGKEETAGKLSKHPYFSKLYKVAK